MSIATCRQLAVAFEEAIELPHFEKTSFRVNKKIFATLNKTTKKVILEFTALGQSAFCSFDKSAIYPVTGKWGVQGWTMIEWKQLKKKYAKGRFNNCLLQLCTQKACGKNTGRRR